MDGENNGKPWKTMENSLKWMIWGYHHLRKHPYKTINFWLQHVSFRGWKKFSCKDVLFTNMNPQKSLQNHNSRIFCRRKPRNTCLKKVVGKTGVMIFFDENVSRELFKSWFSDGFDKVLIRLWQKPRFQTKKTNGETKTMKFGTQEGAKMVSWSDPLPTKNPCTLSFWNCFLLKLLRNIFWLWWKKIMFIKKDQPKETHNPSGKMFVAVLGTRVDVKVRMLHGIFWPVRFCGRLRTGCPVGS